MKITFIKTFILLSYFIIHFDNKLYSQTYNNVEFVNANVGYVIGINGTTGLIQKTTDGGENWITLNTGVSNQLKSIEFVNSNLGFVGGSSGIILKTTDGGNSWSSSTLGSTSSFVSIHFVDEFFGCAVGYYKLALTSNGGTNWTLQTLTGNLKSVFFIDQNVGYVFSDRYRKTTDGGANWTEIRYVNNFTPASSVFLNYDVGYVIGSASTGAGRIEKTTDGGSNWTVTLPCGLIGLNDGHFFDINNGIVVGQLGKILKTTNGGSTWDNVNSGINETLNSVYFVGSDTGYAVGMNNTIIKTVDDGNNWFDPRMPNPPDTLYVAVNGNDTTGDGSILNPWKTIYYAMSEASPNPSDPQTIFVKSGTYSPSLTGEQFVIDIKSNITLVGEDKNTTIIDGENDTIGMIACWWADNISIKNFTFKSGGNFGIGCVVTSDLIIQNNIFHSFTESPLELADAAEGQIVENVFRDNHATAINIGPSYGAQPILKSNKIYNNISTYTGGGIWIFYSNPLIGNSLENANDIYNNTPYNLTEDGADSSIQATYNYWGSTTQWQISNKLLGDIQFTPYTDSTHTQIIPPVSIERNEIINVRRFKLNNNYPNPFNTFTTIPFSLGNKSIVRIIIYDVQGKMINTLVNRVFNSGEYKISFNAKNLSSGIYLCSVSAMNQTKMIKLLLLK